MTIDKEKKQITLSVGELARLADDASAASTGFSLPLRGKLGSEAHRSFQDQRKKSGAYRQEVHLDVNLTEPDAAGSWGVRVRGRLDGLIEEIDRVVVEEIKTIALPSARFKTFSPLDYPRHKRQVDIYLHLLSIARPDDPCAGHLVYINLPDGKRRSFDIPYERDEIEPLLAEIVSDLILTLNRRAEEKEKKRTISANLVFPFSELRTGQEEIIDAVSQTLLVAQDILIEAPTGLGKTAPVLFSTLRYALTEGKQVMFLTSKTTQQDLVFDTARAMAPEEAFPRTLLLRAKQKLCPLSEPNCHPEVCQYLEDFRRRLRQSHVIDDLLSRRDVHPDYVAEIGEEQTLCPYELQLALIGDADLIIGDYNYAFDPGCRPISLFENSDPSGLIFIVDETHNLPDRARGYYSGTLAWDTVETAAKYLEALGNNRFREALEALRAQFEYYLAEAPREPDPFPVQFSLQHWADIAGLFEEAVVPYWYRLTNDGDDGEEDPVLTLQRELEGFITSLNYEGENFAGLIRRQPSPTLEVTCLDASPYLREQFAAVHASVCMSATLAPLEAHQRLLGLENRAMAMSLESPFPRENCRIVIDPGVTTLYREREENVKPIARRIGRFYEKINRKVMAFFPSFELMRRITEELDVEELFIQEAEMSDGQRTGLIRKFKRSKRALFCSVMGGVFAEGIDLPGDLAEAAVIVGVGLPLVCTENELMRAYFDRIEGNGFDVAYLFPGMRRVIQAVGRVIRSATDQGLILLLDRRYEEAQYQRLLPRHWYRQSPSELITVNWEGNIDEFLSMRVS